jgi:hypothetical protein
MPSPAHKLLSCLLLVLLLAPVAGLAGTLFLEDGHTACACGKVKGCCCKLLARAAKAPAGAHCALTPGGRCSLTPQPPASPEQRVVLSLELRLVRGSIFAGRIAFDLPPAGRVGPELASFTGRLADPASS